MFLLFCGIFLKGDLLDLIIRFFSDVCMGGDYFRLALRFSNRP